MARLIFISHPEVQIDPAVPIPDWGLSAKGRDRMSAFAATAVVRRTAAIWSSAERKAVEAAGIFAAGLGVELRLCEGLGEMDRSATGFLPPDDFERTADAFFANPDDSVRGWERARDAQARIVGAVGRIAAEHSGGDLAVVSHGGVGALLWAHLVAQPISRRFDQPGQGHFWVAELPALRPVEGWQALEAG
jgi:broad specificity phosphatase PhoE